LATNADRAASHAQGLDIDGIFAARREQTNGAPNIVGWLLKPPSLDQLTEAIHQALALPAAR
jgi:hypothetical protein